MKAPTGSSLPVAGKQHRDRERGPDTRQHADRGAERDADERPQQIERRQRDAKAVEEGAQDLQGRLSQTLADRQMQPEPVHEDEVDRAGEGEPERGIEHEAPAAESGGDQGEQHRRCDDEAERRHQHHVENKRGSDQQHIGEWRRSARLR